MLMTESTSPKARIKAELARLLADTPYPKITMTMIADNLEMTRQNLYKHYSSKDEILADITTELSDSFFSQVIELVERNQKSTVSEAWVKILNQSLDVLLQNHELIVSLSRSEADDVTYSLLKNMITRALGRIARVNNITINDRDYFDLIVLNIVTAAHQVTRHWAATGMKVSPQKVKLLLLDSANENVIEKLRLCETLDDPGQPPPGQLSD